MPGIIHIEPTSRCPLQCPLCPRTIYSDKIQNIDCDIEHYSNLTSTFDEIIICGNHGDPIYHKDFIGLIRKIKEKNNTAKLILHTNGSYRTSDWWSRLAKVFDANDEINFSIDGIESNNHMYRVNSKWDLIVKGIEAFRTNNSSTKLIWKHILFKYNQDTITQALAIAKQLKFDQFMIVQSNRNSDKFNPTITINQLEENIKNDLSTL